MRLRRCPFVCVGVSPLSLLGSGSVKVPLSLLGSGSVKVPLSLLGNGSVKIPTTSCVYYDITLLSECLPVCVHTIVSFSMRSVSYQSKVGD
jgi:hypothetical protein